MKKRWYRIGAGMLAAALAVGGFGADGAWAASKSKSEAQARKQQLESDLAQAQQLVDKLQKDKSGMEDAVKELDSKLTDISGRIGELEAQTAQKEKELVNAEQRLAQAQDQEKEQYESMKRRIRYMYENSGTTYLEALLGAGSFADVLKTAEYFANIMEYDREQLKEYQETQEMILTAEDTIREDKKALEEMQGQMEDQKQAVDLLMAEKENQLSVIQEGLTGAEAEAEQYEAWLAAENEILAQIAAAEAEARRAQEQAQAQQQTQEQTQAQQQESGEDGGETKSDGSAQAEQKPSSQESGDSSRVDTSASYTGGGFTWPCPASSRITSGFGKRTSPTAGASSNHRGIDIGAPSGSAIVAASDGVVTVASYSSGNGNYVILSHGGGLYTVYCHCSSLLVLDGQRVSRGQTIAKVGSTGISTGPHLHFGVQLNGTYVNPMNYL